MGRPGYSETQQHRPETVPTPRRPSQPVPTQPGWGPALLVEILWRGPLALCPRAFLGVGGSLPPGFVSVPSWLQVCLVGWVLQTQLWTVWFAMVLLLVLGSSSVLWAPGCGWTTVGSGWWQWGTCHSVLLPEPDVSWLRFVLFTRWWLRSVFSSIFLFWRQ